MRGNNRRYRAVMESKARESRTFRYSILAMNSFSAGEFPSTPPRLVVVQVAQCLHHILAGTQFR